MELLPHILFWSLLATIVLSLLLSLLHDEVMNVFWVVYDTVVHSITKVSTQYQARR